MENEKDYFSVARVAEITGKTIQGIYKRIRNKEDKIQPYVKEDEEGNYIIHKEALKVIYKIDYENIEAADTKQSKEKFSESSVEFSNKFAKPKEEENNKAIELLLREQIDLLKLQLEEQKEIAKGKDKLIFELNERLAESQRMVDQQQRLSLVDKQLMLEEKTGTHKQSVFGRFIKLFKKSEDTEQQ